MSYGGQLSRKQMFPKLVTCLSSDVVVLNIEGCASIVVKPLMLQRYKMWMKKKRMR